MAEMHRPVLEKEVLRYLVYRVDGAYVDATVGDGGHAAILCRSLSPAGRLIGLDWDEGALERARKRLKPYGKQVVLLKADYSRLTEVLREQGISSVDGILLDLGASTLQLMETERGFSYHRNGGLDMRMNRDRDLTAEEVVNRYSADELAAIFFSYGEERFSRRIAAAIVARRELEGPITGSMQLAEVVKTAIPARYRRKGGHPARKVFQALRIAVNNELDNIAAVLPQAIECLAEGGRLCVIAYHSLEDRLVKSFFREQSGYCRCPGNRPCTCSRQAEIKILTGKAVKPSEKEIALNPRSRSARLRAAERLTGDTRKEGEQDATSA